MPVRFFLLPGRDRPIRQRHPWVFSGAIDRIEGELAPGDIVEVLSAEGEWLARGYCNPLSQIIVRLISWKRDEPADEDLWRHRLAAAGERRVALRLPPGTTAYRLVYAESDAVPGLVVDRYGDWLAVQFLTAGVEVRRELLLDLMQQLFAPAGIVERSDAAARRLEGLPLRSGHVRGKPPPADLEILQHGLAFRVDLAAGQKTGFYLDQRDNRQVVRAHAPGRNVLNAFSFTGAFAVYALAGGADHVTNIDSSYDAMAQAETNLRANGFDPDRQSESICGDVFQVLRDLRDRGRRFDLVILDPPRFARSKSELEGALRGYKDINLLGMRLLKPGGVLATFSCSGLVGPDLFQKVVFGASIDAARDVQVLAKLGQGADHPILLSFPEAEYLKGLLCRAA